MSQFVAVMLVVSLLALPAQPCASLLSCAKAAGHGSAGRSGHPSCMCCCPGVNDCSWSQGAGSGAASRCRCLELKPPALTSANQDFSPAPTVLIGEVDIAGPKTHAYPFGLALENFAHSFWDSGGHIVFLTSSFRS